MNVVLLLGTLSSAPRRRVLPSGSVLTTWEVTTDHGGKRLSVPVVWFDPPKSLASVDRGEEVVVLGTVRRRFYAAGGRTLSVTEVVASQGARLRRRKQVERLATRAFALVEDALTEAIGGSTALVA